ncbi:MAG: hypothetical protein NUW23_02470 [Firmicutes bacterium]|nr:hypothetical protein [Bacillota bacterium]
MSCPITEIANRSNLKQRDREMIRIVNQCLQQGQSIGEALQAAAKAVGVTLSAARARW